MELVREVGGVGGERKTAGEVTVVVTAVEDR